MGFPPELFMVMSNVCAKFQNMSQDYNFEIWYIYRRLTSYHTLHWWPAQFYSNRYIYYLIPMLYEIVLGTKVQNIPNFKMILRYILNYRNDSNFAHTFLSTIKSSGAFYHVTTYSSAFPSFSYYDVNQG